MRPGIRVLTLAVSDLDRALAFHRDGLGLASSGIIAELNSGTRPGAASLL
jgi:hypothetical protein